MPSDVTKLQSTMLITSDFSQHLHCKPCVTACQVTFPDSFNHQLPVSVGSTDTSLWTHYNAGEREYCGNKFPDGMRKNDQLEQQVITPTTKSASHDVLISAQDILQQGIVSQQDWDQVDNPRVTTHRSLSNFPFLLQICLKLDMCTVQRHCQHWA